MARATIDSVDNKMGGRAVYQCDEGYVRELGDYTRVCDESGQWSDSDLLCGSG